MTTASCSCEPGPYDYGRELYSQGLFQKLFPDFGDKQEDAAKLLWGRILSRCGTDPDLPRIKRVIDYGCGEGTFLKKLSNFCSDHAFELIGLDCSETAISQATADLDSSNIRFQACKHCPESALISLSDDSEYWSETALLVMSHTWFHFNQQCLTKTILTLRPALLLVDVYSTWDWVVDKLKKDQKWEEHGRPSSADRCTYWLRSEVKECERNLIWRGVWKQTEGEGESDWIFQTQQEALTTAELFGGVESKDPTDDPEAVLIKGRTSGKFVEAKANGEAVYVRQRVLQNRTGWGLMDCHVLVARSRVAEILNEAYFSVIEESIHGTTLGGIGGERISKMIQLFDDQTCQPQIITGSREALVILPFDSALVFGRIVPLFSGISRKISKHPLLIEHPNRVQIQYPSANGLFQTCFSRSSSVQAFATQWASDYELTKVDRAIEQLEVAVLGLNEEDCPKEERRRGCWRAEENYPSYFMLPIYYGSLPLFCLALKFPQPFDPATTSFDVYYSTLKSLHDDIHVLLSEEKLRLSIIRPWIEASLGDVDWPEFYRHGGVNSKLEVMEEHLFGRKKSSGYDALDYSLDPWNDSLRRSGGVLGKHWKSWVLGLPSFPIKEMASVKAKNKSLWEIWEKEKEIAQLDSALRISLWFQEGRFFEDKAHEEFVCAEHLPRLQKMLVEVLGYQIPEKCVGTFNWFSDGIKWLRKQSGNQNSSVTRYFGKENVKHFLFDFLVKHLSTLCKSRSECQGNSNCLTGESSSRECAANASFKALKTVFCKTNANTGDGMRFGLARLFHLLDAARLRRNQSNAGTISGAGLSALEDCDRRTGFKFWSIDDPSIQIAEFVHCLAIMGRPDKPSESILETVCINYENGFAEIICEIKIELKENMGGSEKRRLDLFAREISGLCDLSDIHNTNKITILFSVSPDGTFTPTFQT